MGLPEINIYFQTLAVSAIQRSGKGVVVLILKDDTTDIDTYIYKGIDEVNGESWTDDNKDFIEKTFMGNPSKIIIERLPVNSQDYNAALLRLKNKKWNYLAIPGISEESVTTIATWIKSMRDNQKKTFKAVLPNAESDHEGIINFITEDIRVGEKVYSASEYTGRIAGILAGLPFTRSATYYKLQEIESIKESDDPDTDIDNGKLILVDDGESIKIGRGVNSLTTTTPTKGKKFKKIKILEAIDLMMDDIRTTFEKEYTGQCNNFYDNKMLFIAAINAYFKTLQKDEVLDPNFDAIAEIDLNSQKIYLESTGVDVGALSEAQIKSYNTGSKVFIKASGSPLDAMEDLDFGMHIV